MITYQNLNHYKLLFSLDMMPLIEIISAKLDLIQLEIYESILSERIKFLEQLM